MIEVALDREEVTRAARAGVARQTAAIFNGRKPRYPYRDAGEGFARHIVGALAEVAFAKHQGLSWVLLHSDPRGKPDLVTKAGDAVEVRASARDNAVLRCYPGDTAAFYVLAIVHEARRVELRGWMRREEARQDRYRSDAGWIVPQRDLHPYKEAESEPTPT